MDIAVHARFLLGYYQGRDVRGAPERWPSPQRLFAALVDAAYSTSETGVLSEDYQRVLRWMESTPPTAIHLPEARLSSTAPRAYREKGLVTKPPGSGALRAGKKDSESARRLSALAGDVVYYWRSQEDADILPTLKALCAEVPYLGERDSAVLLSANADETPTVAASTLIPGRFVSTTDAAPFVVPLPGRLEALTRAHASRYPARTPSVAADRFKSTEAENAAPIETASSRVMLYQHPAPARPEAPWDRAVLIEAWREPNEKQPGSIEPWLPTERERVGWSTVLHRALVRHIGWDVPPIVTGKFGDIPGPTPANHVAIQVISPQWPVLGAESETAAFLILLPREATPDEVRRITQGLANVSSLFDGKRGRLRLVQRREIDPSSFWVPTTPGFERWWLPYPMAISESRSQRRGALSGTWTVDDALRVAVGYVWRDAFETQGEGSRPLRLSKAVHSGGVRIHGGAKVAAPAMSAFVHKTNRAGVLTGLTGWLRIPGLVQDQQIAAIGQSRHLGGGLLVPTDLPTGTFSVEGSEHAG